MDIFWYFSLSFLLIWTSKIQKFSCFADIVHWISIHYNSSKSLYLNKSYMYYAFYNIYSQSILDILQEHGSCLRTLPAILTKLSKFSNFDRNCDHAKDLYERNLLKFICKTFDKFKNSFQLRVASPPKPLLIVYSILHQILMPLRAHLWIIS